MGLWSYSTTPSSFSGTKAFLCYASYWSKSLLLFSLGISDLWETQALCSGDTLHSPFPCWCPCESPHTPRPMRNDKYPETILFTFPLFTPEWRALCICGPGSWTVVKSYILSAWSEFALRIHPWAKDLQVMLNKDSQRDQISQPSLPPPGIIWYHLFSLQPDNYALESLVSHVHNPS